MAGVFSQMGPTCKPTVERHHWLFPGNPPVVFSCALNLAANRKIGEVTMAPGSISRKRASGACPGTPASPDPRTQTGPRKPGIGRTNTPCTSPLHLKGEEGAQLHFQGGLQCATITMCLHLGDLWNGLEVLIIGLPFLASDRNPFVRACSTGPLTHSVLNAK